MNIRRELSFDGFGINDSDEYGSRIATFTNDEAGKKYGQLFESAPELLAAGIALLEAEQSLPINGMDPRVAIFLDARDTLRAAIVKAEGKL
jgi:hypothetical protein